MIGLAQGALSALARYLARDDHPVALRDPDLASAPAHVAPGLRPMASARAIRENLAVAFERFMNDREVELAERLYHPDYLNHEAMDERSRGPAGAVATAEWLHTCFGGLRYEIERIIVERDMGVAFVTMSGTHEGGLPPGAPATHRPFSVKHVHLVRFADDGRAIEHWAVRDDLGLAMQAGLLPDPPSAAEADRPVGDSSPSSGMS